ncbi:MAG: polysaccharide biosynthesis tyrosine autokinase [Desulfuromonadaceae bacterium]|nr:polysaccharide biosynthesis tyrosine autokinase [Desulfuromonadaceae bacterium]
MSRLENAIEKALKNRQEEIDSSRVAVPSDSPGPPISMPPEFLSGSSEGKGERDKLLAGEPLKVSHPHLLVNQGDFRFLAEEYKKLKTVLMQMTRGEKFRNVLMMTSTVSGEGKTLTALNLGICLAQGMDHTALVVDADLRKPRVHEYLGLSSSEPGLIQCLSEDYPLEKALVKTGIGKLVVLPSGGTVANPVDLLSSKRMKEFVRELKGRYPDRYVLFDTTPILSFAESQYLASVMDGVIFVVREEKAKVNQVKMALELLKKTNNLLGVVYNDSHLISKHDDNYYYSYYNS